MQSLPIVSNSCEIRHALEMFGACLVGQGDITQALVDRYQDMIQSYYERSEEQKLKDCRPESFFQVGYLPPGLEEPRCGWDEHCKERIEAMPPEQRPYRIGGKDPKSRFHWRINDVVSDYEQMHLDNVIPEGIDDWEEVMGSLGTKLVSVCHVLLTWLEEAYGLEEGTLLNNCKTGPHLMAPTGMDLSDAPLGTVAAGFHYDIDVLTIHAKSRFPGLHIWAEGIGKIAVSVPPGYLLVQAGKQLEILTGGKILAGFHEVVVNEATVEKVAQARAEGRSLVRVSSTVFYHAHPDFVLAPLVKGPHDYDPIKAGQFIINELSDIYLPVKEALKAH